MSSGKLCQYGKEIKKKLVDIDQTQEWLISRIREETGLYFDSSYMYKTITGKYTNPKVVQSINEILGIHA